MYLTSTLMIGKKSEGCSQGVLKGQALGVWIVEEQERMTCSDRQAETQRNLADSRDGQAT